MKRRMREFVRSLEAEMASVVSARWYVDDGPMLDRAAANRAGIGWFGKNTNILTPSLGSWVFLGQVITDLALEPDAPLKKTCGSCSRCIDDCPHRGDRCAVRGGQQPVHFLPDNRKPGLDSH